MTIPFSIWLTGPLVVLLLALILPREAYGYVDPGTGSYLFQVGLAVFFASLFAIKHFYRRISTFFKKLLGKGEDRDSKQL